MNLCSFSGLDKNLNSSLSFGQAASSCILLAQGHCWRACLSKWFSYKGKWASKLLTQHENRLLSASSIKDINNYLLHGNLLVRILTEIGELSRLYFSVPTNKFKILFWQQLVTPFVSCYFGLLGLSKVAGCRRKLPPAWLGLAGYSA